MTQFTEVKKNFGFGCMRLPMQGEEVDLAQFAQMVDEYMAAGFNYFDTARVYLGGKSETAIGECIAKRYPREEFILADKLSGALFQTAEDVRPLFQKQLESCGVEYFDFYLMHAQSKAIFEKFKKCRGYEQALELKAEGKIRHVGLSFHDKAEVLDEILTEYPQMEFVQLQLNYMDYDDPAIQGRQCCEVCARHGKPVIVMEPVKGGNLVNLLEDALHFITDLHGGSPASYAIRAAAGYPNVFMVLSGMSDLAQLRDNIACMQDYQPLDETEQKAMAEVCRVLHSKNLIPCTACRYCTDGCPKHIEIPRLFGCMNSKNTYKDWNANYYYGVYTTHNGKASECIGCGKCEAACPQHLPIRKLLKDVAKEFETA